MRSSELWSIIVSARKNDDSSILNLLVAMVREMMEADAALTFGFPKCRRKVTRLR